ncbi:MAG: DUF2528 family protein [Ramlibacter sp.]|nr:DUF2528 family protein [Ramlibacter sp.]MBX3654141.1 DUF2528 family protein [Ramlibacter sp.]MCW5650530.1 DUF2528 family protein [Ramlibacter sp.]
MNDVNAPRRFRARYGDDNEIVLEIDPAVLTLEIAAEINNFYGPVAAKRRLEDQAGDLLAAVARLFAACALFCATADGGADFSEGDTRQAEALVKDTLQQEAEGWPTYESLGIRIVSAYVDAPSYEGVTLEAV